MPPPSKPIAAPAEPPGRSLLRREGAFIGLTALAGFAALSLAQYDPNDRSFSVDSSEPVQNLAGPVGAFLADALFQTCGQLAWLFPLLLGLKALAIFRNHPAPPNLTARLFTLRTIGFALILGGGTALVALSGAAANALPAGPGGLLGKALGTFLVDTLGRAGARLALIAALLFGITLLAGLSWLALFDQVGRTLLRSGEQILNWLSRWQAARRDRRQNKAYHQERKQALVEQKKRRKERAPLAIAPPTPPAQVSKRVAREKQTELFHDGERNRLPRIDLLDAMDDAERTGYSPESLEAMSRLLELKLKDFGVLAEVVAVQPGPVVTRFEIQPAAGVKASKITNLARDLARSLAVVSVRVVEVIAGKSVMGIEVPNEKREIVRLRQVIASRHYEQSGSAITVALGHDIAGQPVVADLARMPHLLVAGTTGSGKSVAVNVMLLSLLYKATPAEVRLLLVDPKMLELAVYEGIPHLLAPVITDMKDAANGLRWCVGEMEHRYQLMARLGVRNLAGYNKKIKQAEAAGTPIPDPTWQPEPPDLAETEADQGAETATAPTAPPPLQPLPSIVVVIDEFADMMMIVGKKVEQLIARIAQKARAAGIHLILATQRPSVDVITGLIKANIPTRMAFQVSSRIDSRTILDQGGAEQLLGHGDMLFLPSGTSVPVRVHGAFVDDHEVHQVVKDWASRGLRPDYVPGLTDEIATPPPTALSASPPNPPSSPLSAAPAVPIPEGSMDDQQLYDRAVDFVARSRKASISSLQRALRIGYNRAARLMDAMEQAGVVSPVQINGNRDVLAPPPD